MLAVLFGYPPKELPDYNPLLTLQSLGIRSGDTVTIEQLETERQRTIEFRDVKTTLPPHTSGITSSTSTNTSQNSNIELKSRENDTEKVTLLNSTDTKNAVLSGTKRGWDHTGGAEPSSSHKRYPGKLNRKYEVSPCRAYIELGLLVTNAGLPSFSMLHTCTCTCTYIFVGSPRFSIYYTQKMCILAIFLRSKHWEGLAFTVSIA